MNFRFEEISKENTTRYLRSAGVHTGNFIALEYVNQDAAWEGFDITLLTTTGETYRDRTFGANKDKSFPKNKYEKGVVVGMETIEEAYQRVQDDIAKKLFYLTKCFVEPEVILNKLKGASDLRTVIEKLNQLLSGADTTGLVNFLTIWKNNKNKQSSTLITPPGLWIEKATINADGSVAISNIKPTKYQIANNMTEEFPFRAAQVEASPEVAGDMPF